jgi:hypothetical protein
VAQRDREAALLLAVGAHAHRHAPLGRHHLCSVRHRKEARTRRSSLLDAVKGEDRWAGGS